MKKVLGFILLYLIAALGTVAIFAAYRPTRAMTTPTPAPIANIVVVTPDFAGVVSVRVERGAGSGVVIAHDENGYLIATAAHIVDMDPTPLIGKYIGEVVALDSDADVAIVRVPDKGQNYKVRKLADARQGEFITAFGLVYASLDKAVQVCYRGYVVTTKWYENPDLTAANCGGHPGMSGGPVVNNRGECVGILIGCVLTNEGFLLDSTTLIVPSSEIQKLLEVGEL